MKVFMILTLVVFALIGAPTSDAQFWQYSQQLFNPFAWIRQGKTADTKTSPSTIISTSSTPSRALNATPTLATKTPIPLSFPPAAMQVQKTLAPEIREKSTEQPALSEKLESKMGDLELPLNPPVTQPPITTIYAKSPSPRTTLSERAATTRRALKIKSTISPLAAYYSSQTTKHTSPIWTTVPITTHHRNNSTSEKTSPSVMITSSHHHSYTQPQPNYASHSFATTMKTAPPAVSSSGGTAALGQHTTSVVTEATTMLDTTTQEAVGTTEEPRDNHRQHDFYLSKREKPQIKIATNISQNLLPLPAGASAALVKPTKYHYYPHNQHIYLLPECAIQQVCNAVYVRLNWTQPLCACPSRYRDPCSASLNSDDQHTTELQVDRNSKRALTLVKTCEPTNDMRICRAPRDWSLLALQNIRTGKSHYLVICRCPDTSILEGPMSHDQPTYASVPGIRVYGMMCVPAPQQQTSSFSGNKRRGRPLRLTRSINLNVEEEIEDAPPFPWDKAMELAQTADWED